MTVADLPKIELHHHLEGAAPPEFIRALAAKKKINLDGVFDAKGHYSYPDFLGFLQCYTNATAALRTPEDYYDLTRAVLAESAANNVLYCETFLATEFCGDGDLVAWREYLSAIQQAATEAEAKDGIILRGIMTAVRHFTPEANRKAAICGAETAGDFLTGFGLAGDENSGAFADYKYEFDMAKEAGLRLTAHAGEWGGARAVRDAITDLNVERIGHGVGAIEDADLMRELVDRGTVLEVCPGSNVALRVVNRWEDHPIERLREAGVLVTVSTDDPPFFNTTMNHEYEMLEQVFGWDEATLRATNITAAKAAFCDDATRAQLLKKIGE